MGGSWRGYLAAVVLALLCIFAGLFAGAYLRGGPSEKNSNVKQSSLPSLVSPSK